MACSWANSASSTELAVAVYERIVLGMLSILGGLSDPLEVFRTGFWRFMSA